MGVEVTGRPGRGMRIFLSWIHEYLLKNDGRASSILSK